MEEYFKGYNPYKGWVEGIDPVYEKGILFLTTDSGERVRICLGSLCQSTGERDMMGKRIYTLDYVEMELEGDCFMAMINYTVDEFGLAKDFYHQKHTQFLGENHFMKGWHKVAGNMLDAHKYIMKKSW